MREVSVKVLGMGCKKCQSLQNNAKAALRQLNQPEQVEHITDIGRISGYGVVMTPALVINEMVISVGKILEPTQIAEFIKEA